MRLPVEVERQKAATQPVDLQRAQLPRPLTELELSSHLFLRGVHPPQVPLPNSLPLRVGPTSSYRPRHPAPLLGPVPGKALQSMREP